MRITQTYLIRAISNLHAGSGQADFGIIDKLVQRDPVTGLPILFASSIKGALRELFNTHTAITDGTELTIFGSDVKGHLSAVDQQDDDGETTDEGEESNAGKVPAQTVATRPKAVLKQGTYRFFDGHLLALPIRSSKRFYYLATCPELLVDFVRHLHEVDHPEAAQWKEKLSPFFKAPVRKYTGEDVGEVRMEHLQVTPMGTDKLSQDTIDQFHNLLESDRIAIISADDFHTLAQDLPTVARNYLEDGISKNLWYEEIVPRESRFYCSVSRPDSGSGGSDPFAAALKNTFGSTVQIGGNATVGYGLCTMKPI